MSNTISPELANEILCNGGIPKGTESAKQWWCENTEKYLGITTASYLPRVVTYKNVCDILGLKYPPTQSGIVALTRAMTRAKAGKLDISNQISNQNLTNNNHPMVIDNSQIAPSVNNQIADPIAVSAPSADNPLALLQSAIQAMMPKVEINREYIIDLIKENADISEDRLIKLIQEYSPVKTIQLATGNGDIKKLDGQLFHSSFERLTRLASTGMNLWLHGPAGTGKTHIACQIAEAIGKECVVQSICAQTPITFFAGFIDANGRYIETELYKKYTNGGVYILDEIDSGNPNTLSLLNATIENQAVAFPNGIAKRHPDFQVIACANTFGNGATEQYIGRNQIELPTQNRFIKQFVGYDESLELQRFDTNSCKIVWQVRKKLEGKSGWVMTQRDIKRIHQMTSQLAMSNQEAYEIGVLEQISPNLRTMLPSNVNDLLHS
jgi:hypothetical protein